MNSQLWVWELNEHWPVLPAAKLLQRTSEDLVALDSSFERPSLNWYARQKIPTLKAFPDPNLILTRNPEDFENLNSCAIIDYEDDWNLLSCKSKPEI